MVDVISLLPVKHKRNSSGWITFNAVCCHHRGENQDRKQRGGFKSSDEGWYYACFNCGYTASFVLGRSLTFKARQFLTWMGVDFKLIEEINLESLRHRTIHGLLETTKQTVPNVEFAERDLPVGLELIDDANSRHTVYIEYLSSRSLDHTAYPYMVSPDADGRLANRIVIPFTHQGMLVGNTARFLDTRTPKYISDMQQGYVFGADLQRESWHHLFVVEGIFDALSIDAVAVLHNDINSKQIQLIKNLGKTVTVIPDQDLAGMKLVERAIELGWAVSMPDWPNGIKDVNDAVITMGRLATILIILQSRETNKYKIEIQRKKLVKRLRA